MNRFARGVIGVAAGSASFFAAYGPQRATAAEDGYDRQLATVLHSIDSAIINRFDGISGLCKNVGLNVEFRIINGEPNRVELEGVASATAISHRVGGRKFLPFRATVQTCYRAAQRLFDRLSESRRTADLKGEVNSDWAHGVDRVILSTSSGHAGTHRHPQRHAGCG
jgi:hypothetical protein